ncbi:1435_t:CDS:1 [Entrophospora sp. SA101]|nr:1435_t:CDS:1 [Entrophospora sp. SA101]
MHTRSNNKASINSNIVFLLSVYCVGIDKVEYATYSVDAISSLTSTQVQNIIKVYTNELVKSQIDYTDLGKLPETEIDASSSDIKESLPETEVSGLSEKVSDETNINIPPINKDTSNESRLPISILPDDPEKNGIMLLKWYWTDFLVYH